MINNDVLRRLRYALDLADPTMIEVFALGGVQVEPDGLLDLLKRDDQDGQVSLDNRHMDAFLTGLITLRRGKLEPRPGQREATEAPLNNNGILRKLRIALNFRDEDMIRMLQLADFRISRGELSALFRQAGHKNYRECGDQILRNFLQGLAIHLRRPS